MRREKPFPVRPGLVSMLAVTLLALPLQSCLKPTSVDCGPDLACPAGYRCSANRQECIKDNCGDGVVQEGEACDDGNLTDSDGCSKTCDSNETCGNRVIDQAMGELCDDGDNAAPGGCSVGCRAKETCGNGITDSGEECDDGNKADTDNCLTSCKLATCGDGHLDDSEPRTEACDSEGESADCNLNCTSSVCGDGIVNVSDDEECDDGPNNSDTGNCLTTCKRATCGDGHVDGVDPRIEACDSVGESANCNRNCTLPSCGDGIVNVSKGEECDDGLNNSDTGNCLTTCKRAACGDGHVDGVAPRIEACDSVGESADCNRNCTVASCGDGIVNVSKGEECDNGPNNSDTGNCLTTCKLKPPTSKCGDGIEQWHEACDDGNTDACGTCNATCTKDQDKSKSTGEIIAAAGHLITDGEILSVHDGTKRLTFEFDNNSILNVASRVKISIGYADSAEKVAISIKDAINNSRSSPGDLKIFAHQNSNTVSLENDQSGAFGNKDIITSIEKPEFKTQGMSEGSGYDCPKDMGCTGDEDCDRNLGLKCLSAVKGKTCQQPPPK